MPHRNPSRRAAFTPLTRRTVLKRGLAGILAYGLAPNFFPSSVFGKNAPSNRLNVGIVGNGLICASHVGALTGRDDCEIVVLSDVDRRKAESTRDRIQKAYSTGTGPARDIPIIHRYEELVTRPDIDVVFVCTPDHWHAAVAKAAMIAGKDVYCEKPLTLTVREGRTLVETARRTGRILQTGTQQRSNGAFRKAAEMVRNGWIGEVQVIRTRLGSFPPAPALAEEAIPEGFDYDRWLGPTPWRPFNARRVVGNYGGGWRCFLEYGGRKFGDWGAHHYDIIQWALGMDDSGPVEVIPKDYNGNPRATHIYANGVRVERDDQLLKAMIEFSGTKGKIWVSRNDHLETDPPELAARPLRANEVHLTVSDDHHGNFFESVRTRQHPIAETEIGHRSASVCHLHNIARQLGRPVRWDPKREEILDDPLATTLLDRPRRWPYAL